MAMPGVLLQFRPRSRAFLPSCSPGRQRERARVVLLAWRVASLHPTRDPRSPMLKCARSFPARLLASALLIGLPVAGCTTTDGTAQGSLADFGSSLKSSVGKNTDA